MGGSCNIDVVVVGGGPAGLRAAEIVASSGGDVLVLEARERIGDKVCADGLSRNALDLGYVPEGFHERELHSLRMIKVDRQIDLRSDTPIVVTFDRIGFCEWQVDKILDEGGEVRFKSKVREVRPGSSTVILEDGDAIGYRTLIGADGSISLVRRVMGLSTRFIHCFQFRYQDELERIEWGSDVPELGEGDYYVFPHKGHTRIGWGSMGEGRFQNRSDLVEGFREFWKGRGIEFDPAKLESWPIQVAYEGFQFGNVFLIGDAAGLPSQVTGEGIYHALVSGESIARSITEGRDPLQGRMKRIIDGKGPLKGSLNRPFVSDGQSKRCRSGDL
jgi:flavin-dependent dehydrogenase